MGLVTLHVDGCAAILCHVKYLKGRSVKLVLLFLLLLLTYFTSTYFWIGEAGELEQRV
jgi:hypothetical protein